MALLVNSVCLGFVEFVETAHAADTQHTCDYIANKGPLSNTGGGARNDAAF
jgi:hypothetical protein